LENEAGPKASYSEQIIVIETNLFGWEDDFLRLV